MVTPVSVLTQDEQSLNVSNHFIKNNFIIIKPQADPYPSTSHLFFCLHLHHFVHQFLHPLFFLTVSHTLPFQSAKIHTINQINNALTTCLTSLLFVLLVPLQRSPRFNNPYDPISLPIFVNRSNSLNNSDSQLTSAVLSLYLSNSFIYHLLTPYSIPCCSCSNCFSSAQVPNPSPPPSLLSV